jgi:hypothetical protein
MSSDSEEEWARSPSSWQQPPRDPGDPPSSSPIPEETSSSNTVNPPLYTPSAPPLYNPSLYSPSAPPLSPLPPSPQPQTTGTFGQPLHFSDEEAERILRAQVDNLDLRWACCLCKEPKEGEVRVLAGDHWRLARCNGANCEEHCPAEPSPLSRDSCEHCWKSLPTFAQLVEWGFVVLRQGYAVEQ